VVNEQNNTLGTLQSKTDERKIHIQISWCTRNDNKNWKLIWYMWGIWQRQPISLGPKVIRRTTATIITGPKTTPNEMDRAM